MRRLTASLAACLLLAACSDSSDHRQEAPTPVDPPPPPVEPTDLDSTGVYRGQLVTGNRNLALVTVTLARDGTTAIAIDSDDDEKANIVFWGETSEAAGELDFSGRDGRDGSAINLTFTASEQTLRGQWQLAGLSGELSADLAPESAVDDGLSGGQFARLDSPGGLTALELAGDGTLTLTAPCEGSGEISTPDPAVNVHYLSLASDCLDWEALVSVDTVAGAKAALRVTGAGGLATRLYQP
ncbi:hypothetical protein [Parahaliea mediterranea]|uniref:Lipoprotein n=1 Tax=Parahaliea mediterranea TaxID=651086 RepID=A0A939DI03_9GAMM|nr:hypothetical protein [Parahaliea mediterranea]MBN7798475.1 hypothetical protein [Parahaliea mediterranea]